MIFTGEDDNILSCTYFFVFIIIVDYKLFYK